MFYKIFCYIFLSAFSIGHCQENGTCDRPSILTDMNHNEVDSDSFCNNTTCLIKCCGKGEVVHTLKDNKGKLRYSCRSIDFITRLAKNTSAADINYSDIEIYGNNIYKEKKLSTKKFTDFTWLQRCIFNIQDTNVKTLSTDEVLLLEKGLVLLRKHEWNYWNLAKMSDYCVDMQYATMRKKLKHKPIYMTSQVADEAKNNTNNFYTAISLTISSFFLLLVFVVYTLVAKLRNLNGMMLSAYVATLLAYFMVKASFLFFDYACTLSSQIQYYLLLASICWIKLMSFHIWITFRKIRKFEKQSRREINVKFLKYASYAWGMPAALTVFAVKMDEAELPIYVLKPFFTLCFMNDSVKYYQYVPMTIMLSITFLLFMMTVYNVWVGKSIMARVGKDSRKNAENNENRFKLYIRLFSVMGLYWFMDIIQLFIDSDALESWMFFLLNAYTMFIGVIIFYLFVLKKDVLKLLLIRFNIENRWTRRWFTKSTNTTRSYLTKSTNTTRSDFTKSSKTKRSDISKSTRSADRPVSFEEEATKDDERKALNNNRPVSFEEEATKDDERKAFNNKA